VDRLINQPVQFGAISGLRVGGDGRVMVALADLSADIPIRLWVGDPEEEWTPLLEKSPGEPDHG
jgi:hypothetical protein